METGRPNEYFKIIESEVVEVSRKMRHSSTVICFKCCTYNQDKIDAKIDVR